MLPLTQRSKHVRGKTLGSPASSNLPGSFINKAASHIRDTCQPLSFKELFIHFAVTRTALKAFSHSRLISSWLAALTNSQIKRQPVLLSPRSSFKEKGELSMNHPPAPVVFWTVSSLRQAVWVMEVTEETPALNRRWQRGREKREWGGGRKVHCLMGETHSEATNLQRLSLIVTGQEVPCY